MCYLMFYTARMFTFLFSKNKIKMLNEHPPSVVIPFFFFCSGLYTPIYVMWSERQIMCEAALQLQLTPCSQRCILVQWN